MADDKLTRVFSLDEIEVAATELVNKAQEREREMAWNELRRVQKRMVDVEKMFEELVVKVNQLECARDVQRMEIQLAVARGEMTAAQAQKLESHVAEHSETIASHAHAIAKFSSVKDELQALFVVCAKLADSSRQHDKDLEKQNADHERLITDLNDND
jgi:hypothetical protein